VLRHVARLVTRLVTRLVAPLVVDYSNSSSITSPTPRVRVPRHVARLVVLLIAPLVVDYSASRRLIVDYFASAVRLGASARRAARLADRRVVRRRLLRLRRASRCLGTSRCSSLVVDYFTYAARPSASARRVARRMARHGVRRRLLRAPQLPLAATLALLQPRCASRLLVSRQHWLYFEYATRRHDVIFRSHHVNLSS
jgi:hypothetical protein